jgi:5'-3' exonuclease
MWFRSYFGVPASITAPDGRPVNAVRGFIDSLATLVNRERPNRMVVCLDLDWRPDWRVALIPSYKAHRVAEDTPSGGHDGAVEEVPDDLSPQVDLILEVLDAFGIATAGAEGFEADDPVRVRVLYLGRGLAKATMFGPREVAERYGVPRSRAGAAYAELALLRGDPSDGLPGVRGVGEKTAAEMITRYGSLENILAAAHDPKSALTKALRARILDATDYIEAAGPVVRVSRDAPVLLSGGSDRLPTAPADPDRLAELGRRNGVTSPIGRLQAALDAL